MIVGWQDWIVFSIFLCCVAKVGFNTYHFFKEKKTGQGGICASCPTGCELKKNYQKREYSKADKKTKKSCCD